MLSEQRQKLQAAQSAVALALRGTGPPPKGFDPAGLALAASSLRSKRLHATARAWPALGKMLGESFAPLFTEYAASHPTPSTPREDALAFARFLSRRKRLPKAFRRAMRLENVKELFRKYSIRLRISRFQVTFPLQ